MDSKLDNQNADSSRSNADQPVTLGQVDPKPWKHRKQIKKKFNILKSKKVISIVFIVLALIASVVVWFVWTNNKTVSDQNKAASGGGTSKDTTDQNLIKISDEQKVNIAGSIAMKNHAFLEQYMAEKVQVTGIDPKLSKEDNAKQAVDDLKYVDGSTGVWSFELGEETISNFKKGDYSTYFKSNSVIGKSSDNYFMIFNFDSAGKINSILMSTTSDAIAN